MAPSILVIDNVDSFVYNLVQYCEELGADVTVQRNADVSMRTVIDGEFDGVLVSPGPGHPRDIPVVLDIIRYCATARIPVLGVCLGHQALAEAFGGAVVHAPALRHGRSSAITHTGEGVFRGLSSPLVVGRYHSLVIDAATAPTDFEITATCDGLIMAMRHRSAPLEGVQFHPESVLTEGGYVMMANWLASLRGGGVDDRWRTLHEGAEIRRAALPSPTVN